MGCCESKQGAVDPQDRRVIEAERRALEAEKQLFELEKRQASLERQAAASTPSTSTGGGAASGAGGSSGGSSRAGPTYLTMATVRQGMAVKVTDDLSHLEAVCRQADLPVDQRRELRGEKGRVVKLEASKGWAKVRWDSKNGYMPVASLMQIPDSEVPSSWGVDPEGGQQAQLLEALAQLLQGGSSGPGETLDASDGFHFFCAEGQQVRVDENGKRVTCLHSAKGSVVTREVVPHTASCDFFVTFTGDSMGFGVAGRDISGHKENLLGEAGFDSSIGALCRANGEGIVIRHDKPVGRAPALTAGDVVGVKLRSGALSFVRNGATFFECGVSSAIRFGVSITKEGQVCEIQSGSGGGVGRSPRETLEQGQLRVGGKVTLPPQSDPRLKTMRVKWNVGMTPHCGRLGRVEEVNKRCVKVKVQDRTFLWDIEVFDDKQTRFCHHSGCAMMPDKKASGSSICDVCLTRVPKGATTLRCHEHDYDICEYCSGKPMLPAVGSKVIRGPTWKWESQDGTPYEEGKVSSGTDADGWFWVEWESTKKRQNYRGPPFQDVVLAHQNGLKGQAVPDFDVSREDLKSALEGLMRQLGLEDTDSSHLPKKEAPQTPGDFHFCEILKSIRVDDSKKVAICKEDRDATLVTEEVFDAQGSHEIVVKFCRPEGSSEKSGGFIAVGICDDNPAGFSNRPIGHASFKGSIGAMCIAEKESGAIVHEGKIVGEAPSVREGDLFGLTVRGGVAEFMKNGVKFHSVGLRGNFRFGVSLSRRQQSVEIMPSGSGAPPAGTLVYLDLKEVPRVTWGQQLKVNTSDTRAKLGQGAFGTTWKGKLDSVGEVAVKLLTPDLLSPSFRQDFQQEVSALASVTLPGGETHPNILRLIAIVPEKWGIVTELCACDLEKHLKDNPRLDVKPRAELMRQVAVGCAWLTERQYVHRDLKMQNILIVKEARGPVAKLADFGLARPTAETSGQVAGTILFMAPETFDGHFSEKSDVYSFSFVMLSTFSGSEVSVTDFVTSRGLLRGIADQSAMIGEISSAIKRGERPNVPSKVPASASSLIKAGWEGDPTKRPSFEHLASNLKQLCF